MKFKIIVFFSVWIATLLSAQTYYYSFGKKIELIPLHQKKTQNNSSISYYKTLSGQKLGVKNEIIIGCKDMTICSTVLKNYPVKSVEKLSDTLYLLTLEKENDPFEIANALYHEECITLSHPNFIKERKRR